jgi:hypothetical protein
MKIDVDHTPDSIEAGIRDALRLIAAMRGGLDTWSTEASGLLSRMFSDSPATPEGTAALISDVAQLVIGLSAVGFFAADDIARADDAEIQAVLDQLDAIATAWARSGER